MKKLLALILFAVIMLTLASCTVETPNHSGADPDLPPNDEQIEPAVEEQVSPEENIVVDPVAEEPVEPDLMAPFSATVENEDFILTLTADKSTYFTGEEIYCEGTLTPKSSITVYGSGGLGAYSIVGSTYFTDGQGGAVVTSELGIYTFDGEDRIYSLEKSGGWSASDPNVDFYDAFFSDKAYTLPAGIYTITFDVMYSTDYDNIPGSQKSLSVSYNFEVVDNGTLPPFMENMGKTDENNTAIPSPEVEVLVIVSAPDGDVVLSTKQSDTVEDILGKYHDFTLDPSDCIFDVTFRSDIGSFYYSTCCGTLLHSGGGYATVSEEDHLILNEIFRPYSLLNDVVEDETEIELPVDNISAGISYMDIYGVFHQIPDPEGSTLCEIFAGYEWQDTLGNCMTDVILQLNSLSGLNYHRDCGTLNCYDLMKSLTLSEEDKLTVNDILSLYLNEEIDE